MKRLLFQAFGRYRRRECDFDFRPVQRLGVSRDRGVGGKRGENRPGERRRRRRRRNNETVCRREHLSGTRELFGKFERFVEGEANGESVGERLELSRRERGESKRVSRVFRVRGRGCFDG